MTLDRKFYSLLLKQEAAAAQLLPYFVVYRVPRGGLYYKCNNYTVNYIIIIKVKESLTGPVWLRGFQEV